MAKYFIYDKSGNKRKDNNGNDVVVKKLTWSNKLMGEETVVVSVSSPCIINWAIGDYIMYRDHKYVLSTTPSVQKQARVSTVNNAIVYDSIKFSSLAGDEMTRCEFRDEVLGDDVHYNFASRKFTFYCNSLIDFANRVKANIVRVNSAWRVFTLCSNNGVQYYYESGIDLTTNGQIAPDGNARPISLTSNHGHAVGKKNQVVSISDQRVWDALQNVKDVFDVNFVVMDRNIFLGANGNVLGQNFRYGYGKGLFKFERNVDDSQAVVTRLRAYGNSKNMPTRYYQNIGKVGTIDLTNVEMIASPEVGRIRLNIPSNESFKYVFRSKNEGEQQSYSEFTGTFNGHTAKFKYFYANSNDLLDYIRYVTGEYPTNTETIFQALYSTFQGGIKPVLTVTSGANIDKWYSGLITTNPICKIPNNMAVENLMLPGFGFEGNSLYKEVQKVYTRNNDADKNLIAKLGYNTFEELCQHYNFSDDYSDPYIEPLPQINAYGLREESITFDGSGDEEDIFPSIEYVMGVDANGETLAKVAGSQLNVVDNGIVADENTDKSSIMYFYITLPNIGDFNPNDYLSTSSPTISMLDGMCGGMEFEIVDFGTKNEDGTRTIKCKRQQSDSIKDLYFPYRSSKDESASFMIKQGDRFSLLNMELPDVYVDGTALYALLPLAIEFLDKNRDMRFKYSLTVDNIHLARQHDDVLNAIEENKNYNGHKATKNDSVYWMMKAGDLVMFGDEDLGVNVDPENPDEITGSVLIESVEIKENESRLPQVNIQLVDEVSVGTLQAIQKQIDGIVKGTITVGSAASGGVGYSAADIQKMIRTFGDKWYLSKTDDDTAQGNISIEQDLVVGEDAWVGGTLHVRKLQAENVEVIEAKSVGGKLIDTAANAVVDEVVNGDGYWELRFKAMEEDGNAINNMFAPTDFIFCEQFRVDADSNFIQSKCWWRAAVGVGSVTNDNGEIYNYVRVSKTEHHVSWNDTPEIGDNILQFGNSAQADRQGAIVFSPVGSMAYMDKQTHQSKLAKAPYFAQYVGIDTLDTPYPLQVISKDITIINADRITLSVNGGTKDISETLSDSFRIYTLDIEAEVDETKEIGDNGYFIDPELGDSGWPDTLEGWTELDYADHIDDVAICTNSAYFRFSEEMGEYGWKNITDQVLIEAIRTAASAQSIANEAKKTLSNMADDNIIDAVEKIRLSELLIEIKKEHDGIIQEAGAIASYTTYDSSYLRLKSFLDYFIADTNDTYLLKDGQQLLANESISMDGSRSFTVSYGTKGGSTTKKSYKESLELYYSTIAALRKAITNGIYSYIDDIAIEGGYDEQITNEVTSLWTTFSAYCTDQNSAYPSKMALMDISDEVSSMSNWLKDPLMQGTAYGSGIITTANYASMFSTAVDENGMTIAQALAFTSVAFDSSTNTFKSSFTVMADNINFSGYTFNVNTDEIKIDSDYFKLSKDGVIINTDNFKIDASGNVTVTGGGKFHGSLYTDFVNSKDVSTYDNVVWDSGFYEDAVVLPTSNQNTGRRITIYNEMNPSRSGTKVVVKRDDGGNIYGADINAEKTANKIRMYRGIMELIAVPSPSTSKCDWILVGFRAYEMEFFNGSASKTIYGYQ